MLKASLILLLAVIQPLILAEEIYIPEYNLWELDEDSFYRVSHKIDKHVVIEFYTTASWCGKSSKRKLVPNQCWSGN